MDKKNSVFRLIGLIGLIIFTSLPSMAQKILMEYDSLPITKQKMKKGAYLVGFSAFNEIEVDGKKPKSFSAKQKKFWGNFTEGAITMLTGLGTSSNDESLWIAHNELTTSSLPHSWRLPFIFPGNFSKERQREKNDDGSWSMTTEKMLQVDWNRGGYGFIIENADTIGGFILTTNVQAKEYQREWLSRMESESEDVITKLGKYGLDVTYYDFYITGIFRGRDFLMVNSGRYWRTLIILDGQPMAIAQGEPDAHVLVKKDRVHPYILLQHETSETDRADLLRLGLVSRLLALMVSKDYFEM